MSWQVESSRAPSAFVEYLDALAGVEGIGDARATLLRAACDPGTGTWLDVGCGTGDDLVRLLDLLGPAGRVVGLDASATMLAECSERVRSPRARFVAGDAHRLPFERASYDGALCNRVLQHVRDPGTVVEELRRVLRPGGRVLLVEPDWPALRVSGGDPATTAAVVRARPRVAHPYVGRSLAALASAAGLVPERTLAVAGVLASFETADTLLRLSDGARAAVASGDLSAERRDAWAEQMRRASAEHRFRASLPLLALVARA